MKTIKLNNFKKSRRENEYRRAIEKMSSKNGFFSPLKAIRLFCSECVGFNEEEVRKCDTVDCILWYFRGGRNATISRKNIGKPIGSTKSKAKQASK